jgi:Cft2 family RNA processing exonuclease
MRYLGGMAALTIAYEGGGIHLPELALWLDPTARQTGAERVFVSHGHADHLAAHREVILSEPTAWFMHARVRGRREEHILSYGQPRVFTGPRSEFRISLLPAGHILGSAMAFIETPGESLLYTGDFKLRAGFTAEACQPCAADVLIMETTFGRPHYRFPWPREMQPALVNFCQATLAAGETPFLLAYSLGKSQDILCALGETGLGLMVHEQVAKMTRIYAHFGHAFAPFEAFDAAQMAGKVVIWPPQAHHPSPRTHALVLRSAIFTGWAIDSRRRYHGVADAAFALSSHADFDELIEMVQRVRPGKVLTVHGFAADFAQALRERGFDARALSEADQLQLPLVG